MHSNTWSVRAVAFLTRSIRQESRLISHHFMRGALALVILFLFAAQLSTSVMFGAAGSRFAGMIMQTSYWFLTLIGLMYFSVAITEEKEEDTLPLLRMTGVSVFSLLLGKSVPRLAIVVLFLLVVSPFLMLSITLGGVVSEQLWASLMGMLTYAFCLSQVGLLCSTICATGRKAFSASLFLWFLIELGYLLTWILQQLSRSYRFPWWAARWEAITEWLRHRSMLMSLDDYLTLVRGEPVWYPQMTSNLIIGLCCFLLSMLLFETCNRRAIGQGTAEDTSHRLFSFRRKGRGSARAQQPALAWKSWHFLNGGWKWLIIKTISLPFLTIALVLMMAAILGESPGIEGCAVAMIIIGIITFGVELSRAIGRVLNDEIFRQTLVSLLMLPKSAGKIALTLVSGTLPCVIPAIVCFVLGWMLMFQVQPRAAEEILKSILEPWFWHLGTWILLTAHLGLYLSTIMRYGGMLIAAAVLWIAAPVMFFMAIATVAMALRGPGAGFEALFRFVLPISLMTAEVLLSFVLQRMTVARLTSVVQK